MTELLRTPFQRKCEELLLALPKSHSRSCFRSALSHLDKGKLLETVDPAMAVFRGITAEEEAASGLLHCLLEAGYQSSKLLKPKNHLHKHAIYPFLKIVALFHGQIIGIPKNYRLHIKLEDGERRLMLTFPIPLNGEEHWAHPIPPLNFGVTTGQLNKPPSYASQITSYVEAVGAKDIVSYLKTEANLRNKVLYASPAGYPDITDLKPDFLLNKQSHVFAILQAHLLIKPWKEIQPYVQDTLIAFLQMIGVVEANAEHDAG